MNKEWGNSKFHTTSSTEAHTALLRRALSGLLFCCHFLARPKKWPRNAPRRSPLEPPAARRSDDERQGFCFNEISPSWAHKHTPKMGLRGKFS